MKLKLNRLSKYQNYIILFLLVFITYAILTPKTSHDYDSYCWREWAKYIFTHGLGNIYKSNTDYLPLYHYILFLFGKFQGSLEFIDKYIYYLKVVTLFFDFLAGFFLIRFLNTKYNDLDKSIFYSSFLFLNIAFFYNTLMWGQVDGIVTCFVFLAFFYAIRQKVSISLIFIILSLNFKLQAIIFIPLLGLLLLPVMIKQFSFKKMLLWISVPLVIQVVIILPFLIAGDIEKLWNVVKGSVDNYPVISANAYNFWYWVIKGNLQETPDSGEFLRITYKHWGLFLFFLTSFIALLPLIKSVLYHLLNKQNKTLENSKIALIAALIPMLFFFCNTQMHERYIHPAIIFLAAYSIMSKKYFPYILGSMAYFLNLEGVLHYFQLKNYGTLIFDPRFIAGLFFFCIVYLFLDLYGIRIGHIFAKNRILNLD